MEFAEQTFQKASIALNILLLMTLLRSPSEGVQGSSPVSPNGGELNCCGDHPTKFSWSQHVHICYITAEVVSVKFPRARELVQQMAIYSQICHI